MPRSFSVPAYRHHKPTNQAVVTVRTPDGGRRDLYLGIYNSPKSRAEYARVVAELATAPVSAPAPVSRHRLSVAELLLAFLKHAERHYRKPDGTPTDQYAEYKNCIKPLHALYSHTAAADFGPVALKAVRQKFVDAGNCRTLINSRVGKLKRIFKWAVEQELVPVTVYTALATVAGLQAGRTEARESAPVVPVSDEVVDATLPHLNRHVAGMVQFQRFTGCRPSEAAGIRRADIDMGGAVWLYRPPSHKTAHKGKGRLIAIGTRAQELLKTFFTPDLHDYLFSPRRAVEERNIRRRAERKSPMTPSQAARGPKANPKRRPAERYTRRSYLTAVYRACDKAKVARWNVYRLRHLFATQVRKAHGLEAAQVLLGHERADVTQTYTARNEALAVRVAAQIG